MSQGVYWTTSQINSLALDQAQTVSPRYGSGEIIIDDDWTATANGIVYFIGNINTAQYGSTVSVSVHGTMVWRVVWNVDQQNYNFDIPGSVLVRDGDSVKFAASKGGRWTARYFVPVS